MMGIEPVIFPLHGLKNSHDRNRTDIDSVHGFEHSHDGNRTCIVFPSWVVEFP